MGKKARPGCTPNHERKRTLAGLFFRAVVGIGSCGPIMWALKSDWGKSLRFKVTIKSAFPCSAQEQKASSPGSGEIFRALETAMCSASSLIRLIARPITGRATRRRASTVLYSSRMSLETSHTKVASVIHWRINEALGLNTDVSPRLNAAIPATSTEVSTTPLGCLFFLAGKDRDLRMLPALGTILSDSVCDLFLADSG
jgi:hypothetical protein